MGIQFEPRVSSTKSYPSLDEMRTLPCPDRVGISTLATAREEEGVLSWIGGIITHTISWIVECVAYFFCCQSSRANPITALDVLKESKEQVEKISAIFVMKRDSARIGQVGFRPFFNNVGSKKAAQVVWENAGMDKNFEEEFQAQNPDILSLYKAFLKQHEDGVSIEEWWKEAYNSLSENLKERLLRQDLREITLSEYYNSIVDFACEMVDNPTLLEAHHAHIVEKEGIKKIYPEKEHIDALVEEKWKNDPKKTYILEFVRDLYTQGGSDPRLVISKYLATVLEEIEKEIAQHQDTRQPSGE